MPCKRLAAGALLVGSLVFLGCMGQRNQEMSRQESAVTSSPAMTKASTQPATDRYTADGFLKPEYWPKTVQEAVDFLMTEVPDESKREIMSTAREDVIGKYHFWLGMSIRNGFGLWANNDALLKDCAMRDPDILRILKEHPGVVFSGPDHDEYLKNHPSTQPVEVIYYHPDSASSIIIEALWDRLHGSSEQAR